MDEKKMSKAIEVLAGEIIRLETSVTISKFEIEALKKENAELNKRINFFEKENAELKEENAELKEFLTPTKRGTENE